MANKKIPDEDLEWLQAHKQSVERRTGMLKGAGMFFYCFALGFALISSIVLDTHSAFLYASISFIILLGLIATLIIAEPSNKYAGSAVAGLMSSLLIGLVIALVYIAPMAFIAEYPVSMQVFYPNHPNITIIQNCTGFTTTNSGYINGQPINPKNTTQCNLPWNMAPDDSNPFNCNISNKSIICSGTPPGQNVTWKGTILNVSKR